ncbi:MAG: ferritin family protein [Desulfuromonadaceae bacterium]
MNALEFLNRFENDCLSFYKTLAAETTDPELRGLYELLADSRTRHLDLLRPLMETVRSEDLTSELTERAGHVINGCRMALTARDLDKEMRGDRDAFGHVVRAEGEMIALCEGMARVEEREKVKALLNWFVDDEKRHLEEIEEIYEFVEAPHCYLEWGEFSNLHPL